MVSEWWGTSNVPSWYPRPPRCNRRAGQALPERLFLAASKIG